MSTSEKLNSRLLQPLIHIRDRGCVAYVAGGAVRDTILKRPISDIDVFVWHFNSVRAVNDPSIPHTWEGMAPGDDAEFWLTDVVFKHPDWKLQTESFVDAWERQNSEDYIISPHILCVTDMHMLGMKYQFIFTRIHPLRYIKDHFDIDLCRAWCDGTKMRVESAFMNDWHNKTLTLSGDLTHKEYGYAKFQHLPRIQSKYPDHRVIIDPSLIRRHGH